MPGDDEREKPKRSWREIDKMRDGGQRRTSSDRERERVQNSTQYTRYKQGLDRLFKGGELPPDLRAKLDPSGEGAERDEALRKIRLTEDSKSFAAAVDEYLGKFALPDDAYLLDRCLDHPRAEVVAKALDVLEIMLAAGELKPPPRSLPQRLQSLELSNDDPDVQERAAALRKKLR